MLNEKLAVAGKGRYLFSSHHWQSSLRYYARETVSEEEAKLTRTNAGSRGDASQTVKMFICRSAKIADGYRIEIWEPGAGYTLASGSSSCAAAAAAHRLGLCDARNHRSNAGWSPT